MKEIEMLYQRIEILESGGLISAQASAWTKSILNLLFERNRKIELEKLEIFTTHLAMALQRILNRQYEAPLDRSVLEELKEEEVYREAEVFARKIQETVEMEIPKAEIEYFIVHLCNLFY